MREYVVYVTVLLLAHVPRPIEGTNTTNKTTVFGFDSAICQYHTQSEGGPIPLWALGYSADIEWKIVNENKVVNVHEYSDPINNIRSMSATVLGANVQVIMNDRETEYYTVVDSCTVTDMFSSMIFFPENYGLSWLTMSSEWFKLMNLTTVVQKNSTTIRSIDVFHWSTCAYILMLDITAQVDFYFANQWTFPQVQQNVINPVRVEILGRKHGEAKYGFHVIGDFYNFNPSPPKDPSVTQPPPGVFCPNKFPGKPILSMPTSFYGIIEIIDREQKTITFNEIWFHFDQKYVRYDTKTPSDSDSDPYMYILDFNTGVKYQIDKYIGTCEPVLVVIGDFFVKYQSNSPDIALMSAAEFFHLKDAQTQYVGKRWARDILCDVWVGVYFDDSVSRNFTAEWYFASDGWTEAVGLSLQTGSLVKLDIFADPTADFPTTWHIHRLDPTPPLLSSFDIKRCYSSTQKIRFLVRFLVSDKTVISAISQSYLEDTLQYEMTKLAMIDAARMSDISTEYFGGTYFYFAATLLDKPAEVNSRVRTQDTLVDVNGAFNFLSVQIQTWSTNITARTGETVTFVGVNAIQLNYQQELTTTTIPTTPTHPYITPPTPPPPGQQTTTPFLTPPIPGPDTTQPTTSATTVGVSTKTTQTTSITSTKAGVKATTSAATTKAAAGTQTPCVCPKTTCPVIPTRKPTIKLTCPTSKQTTTPKPTTPVWSTAPSPATKPDCSDVISSMQRSAQKQKENYVSPGGTVGITIAMLIIGAVIGVVLFNVYQIKFKKRPGLLSNVDDDSRY